MVEQHKNGEIPVKRNWKKISACALGIILVPIGYFGYPYFSIEQSPKAKTTVVAKNNPNDSILIVKMEEALRIVQDEKKKRNVEARNEQKLCSAAKLYKEAISLHATDSVVKNATANWASSQEVIDETYDYLYKKGIEYSYIGAEEAARAFGKRSLVLKNYISESINEAEKDMNKKRSKQRTIE